MHDVDVLIREVRILQRMKNRSIADEQLLEAKEKELDRLLRLTESEVEQVENLLHARAHSRAHTLN